MKTIELEVLRYNSKSNYTDGLFFIDKDFECYTLEDEERNIKVAGKTRIGNGRYKVEFRTVGGKHQEYLKRYGKDWHKGMLWVKEVPNFKYVLIHVGNDPEDTEACLLVGSTANKDKGFIGSSRRAYEDMYPKVRDYLLAGYEVYITYKTI